MIIRSPEPEVKILVDRDPVKTSFEEWARPGHFSRTIAKGPDTTTWIWNLHADAHDFDSHTSDLEEISRKVFSAHFGQLSIIFLWLSGMYFHGARFSNYEAWLSDPTHIGPSAQVVWPIVGQEILNGDVGGGFRGIQITSGFFQIWRASGITSELQLYCTAIGALVFAALMLFAAWQGNFESWVQDPLHVRPIAHAIWDPYFSQPAVEAFTRGGAFGPVNIAYSGVYQWWDTIGLRTNQDLYTGALFLLFLSAISLIAGLFGISALAWTGRLVHVAIPASRGEYVRWNNFLDVLPHPQGLGPLFTGQWNLYAQNPDSSSHLFGTAQGTGTAILTLLGGFHPQTQSLWLTDIAHHHLAIAFIFLVAGHMYRTNFGIGHSMKDLLDAHIPPGGRLGRGHKGLYDTINNSLHFQLGLALASLGVITSLVAQHMYSLPTYAFIAQDFTTQAALYTHHQYIAGFIMTGAFAHGAIFFIRDYNPEQNEDNVLARMLDHKEAIISHLSWASLFLGFHTLGLYVHNDVMLAFGTPEKQILIEPIFAQWIQSAHGKTSYGFDVLLSSTSGPAFNAGRSIWLPGWLNAVNENSNSLFLTIGPGDFLVHHAIALGLHTTTLILVKGALDARGSKLMPDKKDFGYSFPCDGPGRGGTCDISAWDAFYLAVFWMLNTIGWVTFYWHWKHITLWQGNVSQFNESSTYLMGWLRDYLWLNSSQLINGYNPFGMNSLSVWAWMFLFGHLVWATGFMFLISWRGYWQELIETLAWAHERTPLANLIRWRDKPVALSIVQARLVGLAHFSVGYIFTYAAFLIASTSGKFG
ncbi:Photosystem I chlorophyll a apoprotein A2 [Capsicum annuum]|uniref:photosystem I n=2 Tax=Pentapetalae TaxID=1437201 RepID=A0A2G3AN20_CAPAN|nr:Photosystem I chlorophyll a apoprotein A2 [Capsicum annuum]